MKSKGEIKFTQNIIYNFISSIKCDSFTSFFLHEKSILIGGFDLIALLFTYSH
jgi:hypothetical protein